MRYEIADSRQETERDLTDCDSIFGRATSGMDIIHAIEDAKTDPKTDRPYDDIVMRSMEVS